MARIVDQSSNAARYGEYLTKPSTSSPIRDNDSLSTRGATWDFLCAQDDICQRGIAPRADGG